jgi:hypothetical protein
MLAEPLEVTLLVIEAFEVLNIPYLIGGYPPRRGNEGLGRLVGHKSIE